MKVLYVNGCRYEAPTIDELLNNFAQDLGFENYKQLKESEK